MLRRTLSTPPLKMLGEINLYSQSEVTWMQIMYNIRFHALKHEWDVLPEDSRHRDVHELLCTIFVYYFILIQQTTNVTFMYVKLL